MKRSVLLLLMSAIVISGISYDFIPWSERSDNNHQSGQQLNSGVEKTISKRDAKDTSGSISEELTDGANEEVLDGMDSSMESSSAEEQKLIMDSQEAAEPAVRRRRSDVRYRNLYLLATICPDADFSDFEDGSTINSVIEIRDMYAICKDLPKNHP
ncbi:uncharacterized protein LOC122614238 [Drosophila teissieri]|uniref:uncharacterized protein LOC122614238 n=1 Tax=Drosophila teissieri TaxID=7243 RepID=UPI001CBA55BA|nr:uncharacterized protein LOC122614238 [Drosophila teissieri]